MSTWVHRGGCGSLGRSWHGRRGREGDDEGENAGDGEIHLYFSISTRDRMEERSQSENADCSTWHSDSRAVFCTLWGRGGLHSCRGQFGLVGEINQFVQHLGVSASRLSIGGGLVDMVWRR